MTLLQLFGFRYTCTTATQRLLETNHPDARVRVEVPDPDNAQVHKHHIPSPAHDYTDVDGWLVCTKNPYAALNSWAERHLEDPGDLSGADVLLYAGRYAAYYDAWRRILDKGDPRPLFIVHHEDLLHDAEAALSPVKETWGLHQAQAWRPLHGHSHEEKRHVRREFYLDHEYVEQLGFSAVGTMRRHLGKPWIQHVLDWLGYEPEPPGEVDALGLDLLPLQEDEP